MAASQVIDRLVGRKPNWRWGLWGTVAYLALRSAVDLARGNSLLTVAIEAVWFVFGLVVFGVLFLTFNGGPGWIRTKVSVRRVRAVLDPIACALGATVECRWDELDRCTVLYFLRDHSVGVPVGPAGGFNPWSTTQAEQRGGDPPQDVNVLLSAAHRVCGTPGR